MENATTTQLDLFQGKVLSTKQITEIAEWVKSKDEEVKREIKKNEAQVAVLIEEGFIEDVHFENRFKTSVKTYEHEFGYSYNNSAYTAEVTTQVRTGGLVLLYKKFDASKNEIITAIDYPNFERGGKITASSISGSYRALKPSTILSKIKESGEIAQSQYEYHNIAKAARAKTKKHYEDLYPNATVSYSQEWKRSPYNHGGRNLNILTILFPSKSYIKLEVYDSGNTCKYETYDALYVKPTLEQLGETFSNQPAAEEK